MENRRNFYRKAFADNTQNSISDYIMAFNRQIAEDAVKHMTGETTLSREQSLAVNYHAYGVMGLFREWLFEDDLSVEEVNTFLFERTPNFLKAAFSAYPYSSENILQRAGKAP